MFFKYRLKDGYGPDRILGHESRCGYGPDRDGFFYGYALVKNITDLKDWQAVEVAEADYDKQVGVRDTAGEQLAAVLVEKEILRKADLPQELQAKVDSIETAKANP